MGLSNATIFNPSTASQGSMTGALYSMLGVALILTTDMHHAMLASIVESYKAFPATGTFPAAEVMAVTIGKTVTLAFRIGVQMAMPFLIVGTLIQIGFGLLGRLMPQLQIFFLALPIQIFVGLMIFAMTLSVGMMYWLGSFDNVVSNALSP
jgi:flagellar biosynthetic protein FliR